MQKGSGITQADKIKGKIKKKWIFLWIKNWKYCQNQFKYDNTWW